MGGAFQAMMFQRAIHRPVWLGHGVTQKDITLDHYLRNMLISEMANEVFKALGHPLRRQVMALLRKGPRSSGELAEMFDASWPTVSRHLNVLRDADLITAERSGTSIIYRANASVVEDAIQALLNMIGRDDHADLNEDDIP